MWCQEFLGSVLTELDRQMKKKPLALIKELAKDSAPVKKLRIERSVGVPSTLIDLADSLAARQTTISNKIAVMQLQPRWADAPLIVPTASGDWGGQPEDIAIAKSLVVAPIIRREVILTEYQVYQSRALGADSFTLFAGLFDLAKLQYLIEVGRELNMEPLIYVSNEEEMLLALDSDADFIVLTSYALDSSTSLNVRSLLQQVKMTGEERCLILDDSTRAAADRDASKLRELSGIISNIGNFL